MKVSGAKYVATTPPFLTDAIREMSRKLSDEEPQFLSVTPEPWAKLGRCYGNAEFAAQGFGGAIVFGWLIWEMQGVYLVAEHHAVVEADGQLIDVTPTIAGETEVLFVPSPIEDIQSLPLPNQYVALGTHPHLGRYVELARRRHELERSGKAFRLEFMIYDRQMTRLLDEYLSQSTRIKESKTRRKIRKGERQRKKQSRSRC